MAERYQKEIEEILDRVNEGKTGPEGPKGRLKTRKPKSGNAARPSHSVSLRLTPGKLLIGGILLLVTALALSGQAPDLAKPMAWLGIALFIVAYVLFFTGQKRPSERRWRGQPIDYEGSPGQENVLQRFWRWISRG